MHHARFIWGRWLEGEYLVLNIVKTFRRFEIHKTASLLDTHVIVADVI